MRPIGVRGAGLGAVKEVRMIRALAELHQDVEEPGTSDSGLVLGFSASTFEVGCWPGTRCADAIDCIDVSL